MEPIIIDNAFIEKHNLSQYCLNTLQNVSDRDYPNRYSFSECIKCLDMDSYEKMRSKSAGIYGKTVDAVLGVCSCNESNMQKIAKRLLLVELRMDVKNVYNQSADEFKAKERHTKDLLGAEHPIDNRVVLVFNKEQVPMAERWLYSKKQEKKISNWYESCSAEDFGANMVLFEDLPYKPINNLLQIESVLKELIGGEAWQDLYNEFLQWLDCAETFIHHRWLEYKSICMVVCNVWYDSNIIDKIHSMDDDLQLHYMILGDRIKNLRFLFKGIINS